MAMVDAMTAERVRFGVPPLPHNVDQALCAVARAAGPARPAAGRGLRPAPGSGDQTRRGAGRGTLLGVGTHGFAARAPFDRILVTAGAWDLPPAWAEQLVEDGLLMVPMRIRGLTRCLPLHRAPRKGVLGDRPRSRGGHHRPFCIRCPPAWRIGVVAGQDEGIIRMRPAGFLAGGCPRVVWWSPVRRVPPHRTDVSSLSDQSPAPQDPGRASRQAREDLDGDSWQRHPDLVVGDGADYQGQGVDVPTAGRRGPQTGGGGSFCCWSFLVEAPLTEDFLPFSRESGQPVRGCAQHRQDKKGFMAFLISSPKENGSWSFDLDDMPDPGLATGLRLARHTMDVLARHDLLQPYGIRCP
ncbi:hypothetical protein FOF52_06425 [Thermobifida alba]|uniref:Uncharacterized protein n=2 Tax=Thermobifida alba TaxID=53522 RepID=A0ABY4KYZ2_THEAE|nr:hypothetical protein FOF52_06425 [Thermobifida alba]